MALHPNMEQYLKGVSPELVKRHELLEQKSPGDGSLLRQIVLGGQDGLVNVLGILLGVAAATSDAYVVIVAGLAATFAESLSMAAVAYTSCRASQDHYKSEYEKEEREIREIPEVEKTEIGLIYMKKGFRGKALASIVKKITSDKKLWLDTMMKEELGLYESGEVEPAREALVVGAASFVGSILPLLPFFFLPVGQASISSVAFSILILFAAGACKAKLTTGVWWKSGFEMALIGGLAAGAGYLVGAAIKVFAPAASFGVA